MAATITRLPLKKAPAAPYPMARSYFEASGMPDTWASLVLATRIAARS
jgi:hypothetical protein